jgi:acyl-coenzyme A thioesterase PaaI-like protein
MGHMLSVSERYRCLREELEKNPFLSDEQLADRLQVSIHTVRADRRRFGIPEVRKRGEDFASGLYALAKTLSRREIVGDLLEIDLDKEGLSLLDTDEGMGLKKSGVVRGHVLFAQANSLANAVVDAEVALTADATVKFLAPVRTGERLLAKARIIDCKRHAKTVQVIMKTPSKTVFEGVFTIYCLTEKLVSHCRKESDVDKKEGNV